jgi:hypothetical protein
MSKVSSSASAVALSLRICELVRIPAPEPDLADINAAAAAQAAVARSTDDPPSLGPLLDLAEETLRGSDAELRDLVVVGLFEDIQNYLLRGVGSTDAVMTQLGPRSRRAWSALERWWEGDSGAINGAW